MLAMSKIDSCMMFFCISVEACILHSKTPRMKFMLPIFHPNVEHQESSFALVSFDLLGKFKLSSVVFELACSTLEMTF